MNILDILFTIFIGPLKLVLECIFYLAYYVTNNAGFSIIILSACLNIALIPLYNRADKIQEEENNIEKKLKNGVDHIKNTFKGDERYMILQTYYRQNNYSQLSVLKGMAPLLLEIPFFIAAYSFLSNVTIFKGLPFILVADLSKPDSLLYGFNIFPILMTVVNVISCFIYTKGQPLKSKMQLLLMAIVFLVLLYDSPSCLTFYYLLNNIFSLFKNIISKLKIKIDINSFKNKQENRVLSKNSIKTYIFCILFLIVLIGVFIPSRLIASSPEEFIDDISRANPIVYIINCLSLSFGMFGVWLSIYYFMMNRKIKALIEKLLICVCSVFAINCLFFSNNLGNISNLLKYDNAPTFTNNSLLINLILDFCIVLIVLFIGKKQKKVYSLYMVLTVSMFVISMINVNNINKIYRVNEKNVSNNSIKNVTLPLSKDNNNVVIIMLDRAISYYVPYIFNDNPKLQEQYAGFTFYPNTISFGACTNVGVPPIYGGYEYIPEELNKRNSELLEDKHNEALKVLPVLFDKNGYDVNIWDPPYAGYEWYPDLSIYYDNYPQFNALVSEGMYSDFNLNSLNRNLFMYSVSRVMPSIVFNYFYNSGNYLHMNSIDDNNTSLFDRWYQVLEHLPDLTSTNITKSSFVILQNSATHEPEINNDYSNNNLVKTSLNGEQIILNNEYQIAHYEANYKSLSAIGNWLEYLKRNDVYNNTRIIIVSDHGCDLNLNSKLRLEGEDMLNYNALLMFKDFNSNIFSINNSFMTNADVPYLASKDIISNPINYFTGNSICEKNKKDIILNVFGTHISDVKINNGYQFIEDKWYTVTNNCLDINNWDKK